MATPFVTLANVSNSKEPPQGGGHGVPPLQLCFIADLGVTVICHFQPVFHFIVDVLGGLEGNAMCDAVLFCEAASVNQPAFRFHISQRETDVDTLVRGGFDLREDVIAIKRNDGLAGTSFRIFADL